MIVIKKHVASSGARSWQAFSDATCLGTIQHPATADWRAVAPDGARFAATSQRKIVEMMRRHAMPKVESANA